MGKNYLTHFPKQIVLCKVAFPQEYCMNLAQRCSEGLEFRSVVTKGYGLYNIQENFTLIEKYRCLTFFCIVDKLTLVSRLLEMPRYFFSVDMQTCVMKYQMYISVTVHLW